jgi:hypothetical protein
MRLTTKVLLITGILFSIAWFMATAGDEKPWFDMQKCEMCKPLIEHPGLMENTTWEQHSISNGIINVTTIKSEFMSAYEKARVKMHAVNERLMKGDRVGLCGMCTSLSDILVKGVNSEHIDTRHGDVHLFTSDDPKIVGKLQDWGKRVKTEMEKRAF